MRSRRPGYSPLGSRYEKRTNKAKKKATLEMFAVLIFGVSIFTLVSLLTYHPEDPSFFSHTNSVALNSCGQVGAFVSAFLLQCLGLSAFLLPAALFFLAVALFQREGMIRIIGIIGGMSVAVLAFTVFLTIQWKYWPYAGTLLLTGGAFGAWISELLLRPFNSVGSSIVSFVIFAVAVVVSTPVSLSHFVGVFFQKGGAWLFALTKYLVSALFYLIVRIAVGCGRGISNAARKFYARVLVPVIQLIWKRGAVRANAFAQGVMEWKNQGLKQISHELKKGVDFKTVAPAEEPQISTANLSESSDAEFDFEEDDEDFDRQTSEGVEQMRVKVRDVLDRTPQIVPREVNEMEKGVKAGVKKKGHWKLPPLEYLSVPPKVETHLDRQRLIENSKILGEKLADFGIDGEVVAVRPGPVITLYEFKPGPGIKVSRISALSDDLSMALSAESVRILAPLPGKSVVGIEIPSENRELVILREFFQSGEFSSSKWSIPLAMGKDISGNPVYSDLVRMPHLLCAGQTGSGKSVFMNSLICSLLYRFTPDELRMILVDPKYIEFRAYQDIPHLLLPVVDDPKEASTALKWAVREMERRYRILAMVGVRNLSSYNQKVDEVGSEAIRDLLLEREHADSRRSGANENWVESFEIDNEGTPQVGRLPYIVIVIDELADLMMISKKEVEVSIARIAQKARAAGIHLVIATQRPSTDVITGLIKANLPSRVSFQLASFVDSKTILDRGGAERLLGQGDMLFIPPGSSQLTRLHGAFVDDDEIEKITEFLRAQGEPTYREEILLDDEEDTDAAGAEDEDEYFSQALELIKNSRHASASFLQRHLKIGYNRAARLIETMEARGIVGPADGSRPREVLIR